MKYNETDILITKILFALIFSASIIIYQFTKIGDNNYEKIIRFLVQHPKPFSSG